MLIPLRDVLAMPSFRAADAVVLAGDPESTTVRWVHSSEVYEMGGLLAGGEVLLTTGLGLHGRTGEQLAAYVDQIADAGCAALAMEVGRSFFEIPRPMVEAARRRGFVLMALHTVVPFERMAEDFHNLLLRHKTGSMTTGEPLWRDFLAVVVAGEGMRSLLDAISRAAGCVVELHDVEGRLVERSRIASRESADQQVAIEVRGPRGPRGSIVLRSRETRRRMAVADRAAVAVALELGRA
ncbi:MAG: PucR family transcriptional regulator ligand-binding domain-containing protein, partial [Nocardioides sp.]|nr:PucR family transcriptional regulator ligand-binding domain-containing protein [Nocardioides sp.]